MKESLTAIGSNNQFNFEIKKFHVKKKFEKAILNNLINPNKLSPNSTLNLMLKTLEKKNNSEKNVFKPFKNIPPVYKGLSKYLLKKKKYNNSFSNERSVSIISSYDNNNLQLNLSGKKEEIEKFSSNNFKKYILLVLQKEKIIEKKENIKKINEKKCNLIFKNAYSQTFIKSDLKEEKIEMKVRELDKKIEKIFNKFPQKVKREINKMKQLKIHIKFCKEMLNSIMRNLDIREDNNFPISESERNLESKLYSKLLNYIEEYNEKNKNIIDFDVIIKNDFELEKCYSKENYFPPSNYEEEIKTKRNLIKIASESELFNTKNKHKSIDEMIKNSIKKNKEKKTEVESIIKKLINFSNGLIQRALHSEKYKKKIKKFRLNSSSKVFPKTERKNYFFYSFHEIKDNSNEKQYLKDKEEKKKVDIKELFKKKYFPEKKEEKKKRKIVNYIVPDYKEKTRSSLSDYINNGKIENINNTKRKTKRRKTIKRENEDIIIRDDSPKSRSEKKENEILLNLKESKKEKKEKKEEKEIKKSTERKKESKEVKKEEKEKRKEKVELKIKDIKKRNKIKIPDELLKKKESKAKLNKYYFFQEEERENKTPIHIDFNNSDSYERKKKEKIQKEIKALKLQKELDYFLNEEEDSFAKERDKLFFEDFKEKINSLKNLSREQYVEYLISNYSNIQEELDYVKDARKKAREINDFVDELNFDRLQYKSNHQFLSRKSKVIDGNLEFLNLFKFYK